MQNQLRVGASGVFGFDMGAVMTFGQALGVSAQAIAELMPAVEAAAVRRINEEIGRDG